MRSVKLSKALAKNKVYIRNARTGQVLLKFRNPNVNSRLFHPYPVQDQTRSESFVNLSQLYSAEQLLASNLEDLVISGDLELGEF